VPAESEQRIIFGLLLILSRPPLAIRASGPGPEEIIRDLKDVEAAVGLKPTQNFERSRECRAAYHRCYFTGKLELPESYNGLKLREGRKEGCSIDEDKYDVFFYTAEAVATGHAPITEALAAASPERVAMVVPHEDFHVQVRELPDRIAEAAATLVGFATAAVASGSEATSEAELFLRKSAIINRYYDQLGAVYRRRRSRIISTSEALREKCRLLEALQKECAAIQPDPRSFNKCVSAPNNAGLAFDHTYTKFYPLIYRIFSACGQDLRCTVEIITRAPKRGSETETIRYFEERSMFTDRPDGATPAPRAQKPSRECD